jgi:hypothetical protein
VGGTRRPGRPGRPAAPPRRPYLAGGDPRTVAWDHDDGQAHRRPRPARHGPGPHRRRVTARSPRTPAATARLVRHAVYEVQIVRPAPGLDFAGSIPGGTAIDAHGYLLMSDPGTC